VPKEDYLLKYLERLSRVIAAMLGLREKGCLADAISLADETYKELIDCKVDKLVEMSTGEFMEIIRKTGYSSAYINALAQLAFETATSFHVQENNQSATSFYQKTLELYLFLNEKDKTFSFEREQMISDLKTRIQEKL
jgi:hypothetical protein